MSKSQTGSYATKIIINSQLNPRHYITTKNRSTD